MDKYLENWLRVIEEMKNDNTYKVSWGKAIMECINFGEYESINHDIVIIKEEALAKKMIKYYWNQSFFFRYVKVIIQ